MRPTSKRRVNLEDTPEKKLAMLPPIPLIYQRSGLRSYLPSKVRPPLRQRLKEMKRAAANTPTNIQVNLPLQPKVYVLDFQAPNKFDRSLS